MMKLISPGLGKASQDTFNRKKETSLKDGARSSSNDKP